MHQLCMPYFMHELGLAIYFTYDNIHMLKLLFCIDHVFLYLLLNCFVQYNVKYTGVFYFLYLYIYTCDKLRVIG